MEIPLNPPLLKGEVSKGLYQRRKLIRSISNGREFFPLTQQKSPYIHHECRVSYVSSYHFPPPQKKWPTHTHLSRADATCWLFNSPSEEFVKNYFEISEKKFAIPIGKLDANHERNQNPSSSNGN